jgi:hypothetical protein
MNDLCRSIQALLSAVYHRIYGADTAEFVLLPMPRLEVESVADMKVLFDIGGLTPDMGLQLSQILLGEDIDNKRRRTGLAKAAPARPPTKTKPSPPPE